MVEVNLVRLGKMNEILLKLNFNSIPFGENTEDIAFSILLETTKPENEGVLDEILSVLEISHIKNPLINPETTEEVVSSLDSFFVNMGKRFPAFLATINYEKKQQSDMVGNLMATAMLEKLKDSMNSSTDLESFAKMVSETLQKDLVSPKPVS
jgi:hypothetical protein